eukprot:COSAG03_NODE_18249_length_359_cov_0.407692_1_plen_21_part_01
MCDYVTQWQRQQRQQWCTLQL